jgi:hypothetical protein
MSGATRCLSFAPPAAAVAARRRRCPSAVPAAAHAAAGRAPARVRHARTTTLVRAEPQEQVCEETRFFVALYHTPLVSVACSSLPCSRPRGPQPGAPARHAAGARVARLERRAGHCRGDGHRVAHPGGAPVLVPVCDSARAASAVHPLTHTPPASQFGYLALTQAIGGRDLLPPPPEALGL